LSAENTYNPNHLDIKIIGEGFEFFWVGIKTKASGV